MGLRTTSSARHLTAIRVIASLPLIGIGAQHLLGMAPMQPILEGAGIPFPELLGTVVPVLEVLAGLSLLLGLFARVGAVVSLAIMAVAIHAHMVHDWSDEPTILLPIAVLGAVLQVAWSGAGAFSADLAAAE